MGTDSKLNINLGLYGQLGSMDFGSYDDINDGRQQAGLEPINANRYRTFGVSPYAHIDLFAGKSQKPNFLFGVGYMPQLTFTNGVQVDKATKSQDITLNEDQNDALGFGSTDDNDAQDATANTKLEKGKNTVRAPHTQHFPHLRLGLRHNRFTGAALIGLGINNYYSGKDDSTLKDNAQADLVGTSATGNSVPRNGPDTLHKTLGIKTIGVNADYLLTDEDKPFGLAASGIIQYGFDGTTESTNPTVLKSDIDNPFSTPGYTNFKAFIGLKGFWGANRESTAPAPQPTPAPAADPALDTDGDGLTDEEEKNGKARRHGKTYRFDPTDYQEADSDGDGLTDFAEVFGVYTDDAGNTYRFDTDKDMAWDADSDDDGYTDGEEIFAAIADANRDDTDARDFAKSINLDGDKLQNHFDTDSDGDKILDGKGADQDSLTDDTDADGKVNALDRDADGDGALDRIEVKYGLNWKEKDSDGDGRTDGKELDDALKLAGVEKYSQLDDSSQMAFDTWFDLDGDTRVNALDDDSDGDFILDKDESGFHTEDGTGRQIPNYLHIEEIEGVRISSDKIEIDDKIFFEYDSDKIQTKSYELLNTIARFILTHSSELAGKSIEIQGHTDTTGSEAYNRDLSERRAISVKTYLTAQGVDHSLMNSVGFGESQPIYPNDKNDEDKKEANRRVEFHIKEGSAAVAPTPASASSTPVSSVVEVPATPMTVTPYPVKAGDSTISFTLPDGVNFNTLDWYGSRFKDTTTDEKDRITVTGQDVTFYLTNALPKSSEGKDIQFQVVGSGNKKANVKIIVQENPNLSAPADGTHTRGTGSEAGSDDLGGLDL